MRAPPPIAVEPGAGAAWRGALLAVAAATVVVLGAWCLGAAPEFSFLARASVLAGVALPAAAVVRMAFKPTVRVLRWTGADWEVEPHAPGGRLTGDARVALDLGGWMLLRFVVDGSPGRRPIWLAVGRGSAAGGAWHALRCALYAPRAAPPS